MVGENIVMKVVLITGRTLAQGQSKEYGKTSAKYMESCATCEIDEADLAKMQIKVGENVKVTTKYGSVVVKAMKSREANPGFIFIPYGPWANMLIGVETHGTGMPSFKGVEAEIEPAISEKVLGLEELLKTFYGGRK